MAPKVHEDGLGAMPPNDEGPRATAPPTAGRISAHPEGAGKPAWRAWARDARRVLSTPERGGLVTDRLRNWPTFERSTVVLGYLAFGDEIDLAPAFDALQKPMVVTRSLRGAERGLSLHWSDGGTLERLASGLRQPVADTPELAAEALDLVLLPGLAFDLTGHRLGYGQGYFDRFLPRVRPEVPIVGITFDALVVDALPSQPHDVRMTHLLTETGVRAVDEPPPA